MTCNKLLKEVRDELENEYRIIAIKRDNCKTHKRIGFDNQSIGLNMALSVVNNKLLNNNALNHDRNCYAKHDADTEVENKKLKCENVIIKNLIDKNTSLEKLTTLLELDKIGLKHEIDQLRRDKERWEKVSKDYSFLKDPKVTATTKASDNNVYFIVLFAWLLVVTVIMFTR